MPLATMVSITSPAHGAQQAAPAGAQSDTELDLAAVVLVVEVMMEGQYQERILLLQAVVLEHHSKETQAGPVMIHKAVVVVAQVHPAADRVQVRAHQTIMQTAAARHILTVELVHHLGAELPVAQVTLETLAKDMVRKQEIM